MSLNPMNLPKLDLYVNDFSGVIETQIATKYNNLFSEHKNTSGEQIAVVLFPHRQGNALLDIGVKVFNENGIGEKETNNGLLLIIATEEKKLRIVTGKGMEVEFGDEYCTQIIETELRPLLNAGKYDDLLQSWYEISTKKRKIISENAIITPKQYTGTNKKEISQLKMVIIMIFLFLVVAAINTFLEINGYIKPSGNSGSSYNSSSSSSSSSYRSSSSSSSSSSSFGGGSSNGGGGGD